MIVHKSFCQQMLVWMTSFHDGGYLFGEITAERCYKKWHEVSQNAFCLPFMLKSFVIINHVSAIHQWNLLIVSDSTDFQKIRDT